MLKPRATTLENLADSAIYFYREIAPHEALVNEHLKPEILPVLREIAEKLQTVVWNKEAINIALKETLAAHKLKMGQIGIPLRVAVSGGTQTPSLDSTLELIGRDNVVARIKKQLND